MGCYNSLVCHTCRTIYQAYKSKEMLEIITEVHKEHNYEHSCDGQLSGGVEYEPNDYEEVDLYKHPELLEVNE